MAAFKIALIVGSDRRESINRKFRLKFAVPAAKAA